MKEIWKDIEGFEGLYEVSNLGEVRTHINKTTTDINGVVRRWKQRILKPEYKDKKKYKRVSLCKDSIEKSYYVHRLVAIAFIPNPHNKPCVNHKDGNKENNSVSNLEWCTIEDNTKHAFMTGLISTGKKVRFTDKLTQEVTERRSLAQGGYFLNKSRSYLCKFLKDGRTETERYKIELVEE